MKPVLIYHQENIFSQSGLLEPIKLPVTSIGIYEKFAKIVKQLDSQTDIPAIFIMVSLSEHTMEFLGLQMAHFIRIATQGKGIGELPIVLISSASLEELFKLSDYASILRTPSVKLVEYSLERVKESIEECTHYSHLNHYSEYLKKTVIPSPARHVSHHSLTGEWSLYQWSRKLGLATPIDSYVENNLYFKYKSSLHTDIAAPQEIKYPTLDQTKSYRILLIEDEWAKGWKALYQKLFGHYKNVTVDCLETVDFDTADQARLTECVQKQLSEQKYHLILLDIRLLQTDLGKNKDYSGLSLMDSIRKTNEGIQCIVVTASNKAWNLTDSLNKNAFAYITKESVEESSCTVNKLNELLEQSIQALKMGYFLRNIAQNRETITAELNNHKTLFQKAGKRERKELAERLLEQQDIAWEMLLSYRFAPKYLRYAFISYYQMLEIFVEPDDELYIQIDRKGNILCKKKDDTNMNCSESIHMEIDRTSKETVIRMGRPRDEKERIKKSTYSFVAGWMAARTNPNAQDLNRWKKINTIRNENAHGAGATTNEELENQLKYLQSIIIDFVKDM